MGTGTVEVWINEDDDLCFFDDNGNVLKVRDWARLAKLLMHEFLELDFGGVSNPWLDDSESLEGSFSREEPE